MNVQTCPISNIYLFNAKINRFICEVISIWSDVICGTRVRVPVGVKGNVRTSHHTWHRWLSWKIGGLEILIKLMLAVTAYMFSFPTNLSLRLTIIAWVPNVFTSSIEGMIAWFQSGCGYLPLFPWTFLLTVIGMRLYGRLKMTLEVTICVASSILFPVYCYINESYILNQVLLSAFLSQLRVLRVGIRSPQQCMFLVWNL